MKGYEDLILRVDFGLDGPDPIWRAGRRRCSPELCSAAASSPEQAETTPQGSIRPGSGSRMDYAPCVVHLGSLQASGRSAEARAATAAGRHVGGSPASAAGAPRVRHK